MSPGCLGRNAPREASDSREGLCPRRVASSLLYSGPSTNLSPTVSLLFQLRLPLPKPLPPPPAQSGDLGLTTTSCPYP